MLGEFSQGKTKAGHGGAVFEAVLKWGEVFGTSRRVGKPALRAFYVQTLLYKTSALSKTCGSLMRFGRYYYENETVLFCRLLIFSIEVV